MCDSSEGRSKMLCWLLILVFSGSFSWTPTVGRVIQKRAAFYIANETMCIVDGDVYRNGDPVPTDDECERCTCRPPGFSCVLRDCETKPGCKAVRKVGECCPEYVCGCVHNSRLYEDGELIRDLQNNCYTCRCHGSSISCTFADCHFRGDCPPEYIPGECCPRYDHCPPASTTTSTTTTTTQATTPAIVQEEIEFINMTTHHLEKFTSEGTTVTVQDIVTGGSQFTTASDITAQETLFTVKFTLSGERISSIKDYSEEELTTLLPRHTGSYKETTRHIVTAPGSELTSLKFGLVAGDFETTTLATSTAEAETHYSVTTQTDVVLDTESTTQSTDIHSEDAKISSTTELEDLTEHGSGISDSDSHFVTTIYEGKVSTLKESEASTFDSDSSHYSTPKYGSSPHSLRPVYVPEEEEVNETTTHEDHDLQTEPQVSTEDSASLDTDRTPAPSLETAATLTEHSEVSTSDKISPAESFDSKSVLAHTDGTAGHESTTEQSETHPTTQPTAEIDLQTSDDADLISHASHSTTLDSEDLLTVSDHPDKESSIDFSTDDEGTSHFPTHDDSDEHVTSHELQPTSTTQKIVTVHDKTFIHDYENDTTDEHEDASDSYPDSHTDADSTDGHYSEPASSTSHETASDFTSDVTEPSLDHTTETEIFNIKGSSDIDVSSILNVGASDAEEASNYTLETESPTEDAMHSEETGSTDTHDDKSTIDHHTDFEELSTSDAVSKDDLLSTVLDHHISSEPQSSSSAPEESQSTITEFSSVSSKQDLTDGTESLAEDTTTSSSAVDIQSQSSDEYSEVEYSGTTRDLEPSLNTVDTTVDENTSDGEVVSESEAKHDVTELTDLSHGVNEGVSRLPTTEHSESEEFSTPLLSASTEDEESVSHPEVVTGDDAVTVTEETLQSVTLRSGDSETSDHVTDREVPTTSVPATETEADEHEDTGLDDDVKEELETEATSDDRSTPETRDQTTYSSEKSSEPQESVDLHEPSEIVVTTESEETPSHTVSEDSPREEIGNIVGGSEVTPLGDTTTGSDLSSKVTDFSSQSTTEEITGEESHADTLHVQHVTPLFPTHSTTITTSGPEHTSSTTESDIPSGMPAFEPPLANILKQSMLFHRPTPAHENVSVSLLSGDIQNDKTDSSSNSSGDAQFVRLSLTLAEEDRDNATLINEDSENKIFVLNHEYTISDSEVSDSDGFSGVSEDASSSVTEESEESLVLTEQGTSKEYPPTTDPHGIDPNPFYSDKSGSIPPISETEVPHSESPTEKDNLTPTIDLNLLSETLDSNVISHDSDLPSAVDIHNIDPNLSEEHSTTDAQTTPFSEVSDSPGDLTTRDQHGDENRATNTELLVSTNAPTQFESTVSEELIIKSHTSADYPHESTTEEENSDFTSSEGGVGSETIEHTVTSSEDHDDNTDGVDHTEKANSEISFDHSGEVTGEHLTSTNFSDEDDSKHNETGIDYSYHDAETAETSEEDKGRSTVSLTSLDPEMITALQEIGTSLIGNDSDLSNSSFPVDTEHDHLSTTEEDGGSVTPSTVKVNILFGQDSYDSRTETTETESHVTTVNEDFSDEDNFHNASTERSTSGEESNHFTNSEDLEEVRSTHVDDDETVYTTVHQDQNGEVSETETDSNELLNVNPDSNETPKSEENAGHHTESPTTYNTTGSSDEGTPLSDLTTVESHEAEEISSPFTILEYIGDLFSGVSTFSTESHADEGTTSEEEIETESDSEATPVTDSTTGNENMTLSPDQTYISALKNQFSEYGSLGGVFITGQSKYNRTTSDEKSQDSSDDSINSSNISDATEDSDLVHLNSDIHIDNEAPTGSETEHSHSEEANEDSEFMSTEKDHHQSTTTHDVTFVNTELVEDLANVDPEALTTVSDIEEQGGPEKGDEWFKPLDSDLSHEEDEKQQSVSDETEVDHVVTTDVSGGHGPEKGGDVFEPSFPELFPLGSATSDSGTEASETTDDERSVTESIEPETEDEVSTQNNVVSTTKVPSVIPESQPETSTNDHFKSQFVPPLPILLKDLSIYEGRNNSESKDPHGMKNEEKSVSDADVEGESNSRVSKFEYARTINHPFPLSDIISRVFKAPGYDSEVHLSPLTGSAPFKTSQFFRLKRETREVPGEGNPESSTYTPSSSHSASSLSENVDPLKNKNILLVEGYGQKPAGFFPVTSSFIIVHSDEDSEENETGGESKQKTAPSQSKGGLSDIEFLDESPFESLEKEVSLLGAGKSRQTK